MIAPGAWLGVIGGGQLGRMFAMAAHRLGYRVILLEYPGYGGRPGAPSEAALVSDADSNTNSTRINADPQPAREHANGHSRIIVRPH